MHLGGVGRSSRLSLNLLEAAFFRFDAESQDDEGHEYDRAAPERVADARGPQSYFSREQLRDVNREEERNEDVDRDDQRKSHHHQDGGILNKWIKAPDQDGEQGGPDECRLASPKVGGESADRRSDRGAKRHDERIAKRSRDAQSLLYKECRQPGYETVEQGIDDDQRDRSHNHSRKNRGAEE